MTTNRYPGICTACGTAVDAHAGVGSPGAVPARLGVAYLRTPVLALHQSGTTPAKEDQMDRTRVDKFAQIMRLEQAARLSWVALTYARPIDADDRGYRGDKRRFYAALDALTAEEMAAYREWRRAELAAR